MKKNTIYYWWLLVLATRLVVLHCSHCSTLYIRLASHFPFIVLYTVANSMFLL